VRGDKPRCPPVHQVRIANASEPVRVEIKCSWIDSQEPFKFMQGSIPLSMACLHALANPKGGQAVKAPRQNNI
jgi:hypothetical protein